MSVDNFMAKYLCISAGFRIFMGGFYIKKTAPTPLSFNPFDFLVIQARIFDTLLYK